MRVFLLLILSFLAGCGTTLSQPIRETDRALEQRLVQVEDATRRLKSEAIVEARDAAAALVANATAKLEEAGKGVITHAASEFDSRLEKRLDQVGEILEERIDQSLDKIDSVISKRQDDASEAVRKLMRDEVPVMVADSVSKSADRIAERLGAVKRTEIGPDGLPVEVWVAGGSGLLGALGWIVNQMRVWRNNRSGKKRFTEEEVDERVSAKVREFMENRSYPHVNIPAAHPGSVIPPNATGSFTWTIQG